MNSVSQKVASISTINLMGNGVRVVLSFLTSVLASRWLGAYGFGQFNSILAYTTFLNYILTLGFDASLNYFIPTYLAEGEYQSIKRVFATSLISSAIVGVITMVLATLIVPVYLESTSFFNMKLAFFVMVVQTLFWAWASVFSGFLRGVKDFLPVIAKDQFIFPILHLIGLIIFVKGWQHAVTGYAIGYFFATFCTFLFISVLAFRAYNKKIKPVAEGKIISNPDHNSKYWLGYSLPLGVMAMLEPMVTWVTVIVGGWYLSQTDIGKFSVAMRVAVFAQFLLIALAPIFGTFMAELFKQKRESEYKTLYQTINFWSSKWALVFGFFLVIAAEPVLGLFGGDFNGSTAILYLVLPGTVFEGLGGGIKNSLVMCGRNKINVANFSAAILFNILLSLILIPRYGVNGAAMAFSSALILLNLLRMFEFFYLFGVAPMSWGHWKYILSMTAALSLGAGVFTSWDTQGMTKLLTAFALFCAATLLVFWSDRQSFLGRRVNA